MKYKLYFPKRDPIHGMHRMEYMAVPRRPENEPYELVYEGEVYPKLDEKFASVLEVIWQRHNEGDDGDGNRPRAREIRSMCVGDIVEIVGECWIADMAGFKQLSRDAIPTFKSEIV